jgi:hypothetical protein
MKKPSLRTSEQWGDWGQTLNCEFEGFDGIKPKTKNINVAAQQITGVEPKSRAARFSRSVNIKMLWRLK